MRTKFILAIILSVLVYAIGNFYVAMRFYHIGKLYVTPAITMSVIIVFSLLACSYLAGRIASIYLPGSLSDSLIIIGSYWLALSFYLVLLWGVTDIVSLVFSELHFSSSFSQSPVTAPIIFVLSCGIVIYGAINAYTPRIRRYDITVNKIPKSFETLHIIVVSDVHLGLLVNSTRLSHLVNIINSRKPDLILLPGDILDEAIGAFADSKMPQIFRSLKSPYGVFAALGSHEYIWGHADKAITYLEQAGITVLRDSSVKIADSIYIVGRDDYFREQLVGTPRAKLNLLLNDCDSTLPIILLDHQPHNFDESVSAGIDIHLSGHTHHGQFFPISLITRLIFELDWGYKKKGNTHFIVSSGFGTWGPPIRVGTQSEIVDLHIKFT
jgi:predicted MPP superfamily phosphohydrolase